MIYVRCKIENSNFFISSHLYNLFSTRNIEEKLHLKSDSFERNVKQNAIPNKNFQLITLPENNINNFANKRNKTFNIIDTESH